MKTILHISKYYYPDFGGIETVALYLAEGLTMYKNIVVCFATDGTYSEDNVNGITVYRVPVNFTFMSQDVAFSYRCIIKNVLLRHHPDAVHVHCPNPFVYPLVCSCIDSRVKVVLHWHSDILSKGLMYYLVKPFEDAILKRADLIISTSPNYITASKPLLKYQDKVTVAQNGLITDNFDLHHGDEDRIREIKSLYQGKKIIITFGRHVPYKGIDNLIKADKLIKGDCVILIAGKGPEDKYLKSIPCSDRVTFLGRITDRDLRCYLHAADIFAFPSVNKAEAFGIALAEAMYCYCAPVTFTIKGSGVNWVSIGGKTGEEVPLSDINAFAAAIDRLISDEQLCSRYQTNSNRYVTDNFTSVKAVSRMSEIYSQLFSTS